MRLSARAPLQSAPCGGSLAPIPCARSAKQQSSVRAAGSVASRLAEPRTDGSENWVEQVAQRQRGQYGKLAKSTDRLYERLLDLDVTDLQSEDAMGLLQAADEERTRSHHSASSSGGSARMPVTDRIAYRGGRRMLPPGPVPASPEVVMSLLRRTAAKREVLQELDVTSPAAVARRLLLLVEVLGLSPEQLVGMARRNGRLLLKRPEQLRAALEALTDVVAALGPPAASPAAAAGSDEEADAAVARARQMAAAAPGLLLLPPERLQRSGRELAAVCKARGVPLLPMLQSRPDLLRQSASGLAAKMDVLPGLLGLPPRRMREVLARCPQLLRRSPAELARRYRLLQSLFGVPAAFMAELVAQEPRVLGGFGGTTLQAKFAGLAGRYGRFQDDVADMILVDPSVLINAVPAPPLGARSGVGSVSGSSGAGSAGSPSSPSPSASVLSLSSLASLSSLDGWELPAAGDLAAGDVAGDGAEEADAAERAEGDAGEAEVGARSGRRPGALAPPPPVLDQVLALSAATGVPLGGVLQLIAEQSEPHTHTPQAQQRLQVAAGGRSRHGGAGHELLAGFGAEQVAARLAALGSALGLGGGGDLAAVRATLAAHPRLLLLSPQQLAERLAAAEQLLAAPPGAAAITPAAATPGESGSSSAAAAATQPLPQRHPELLLLEPGELRSRVTALRDLLLPPSAAAASTSGAAPPLSLPLPPRLWSLLASQPGLLVGSAAEGAEAEEGAGAGAASAGAPGGLAAAAAAPPSDPVAAVREKLLVMQSLFEIPRPLVLELVFREPGLLAVSATALESKFRALASSFGAFSADAIGVVLADPSLILRAGRQGAAADAEDGRLAVAMAGAEEEAAVANAAAAAAAAARAAGAGAGRSRSGARGRSGSGSRSGSPAVDRATTKAGRRRQRAQAAAAARRDAEAAAANAKRGAVGGKGAGAGSAAAQQPQAVGQQPQAAAAQQRRPQTPQRGSQRTSGAAGVVSMAGAGAGGATSGMPGAQAQRAGSSSSNAQPQASSVSNSRTAATAGGTPAAGAAAARAEVPAPAAAGGRAAGAAPPQAPSPATAAAGGKTGGGADSGSTTGAGGTHGGGATGGVGSGSGSGSLGALGAMSAADFDRLGEEGLPPPPPPSRRRRRPQAEQ
ncbi:hypothetical protein CHLRE_17g697900v5 [Chlamydomonas reinhardtii]|uniref:Uncharacterized protein n=1 Tax=Chlamydomonas reinhardtii TaxID=3055 RepID=A0A2K3CNQ5_CHLRE|nr:uncharacterized protein CHLRE_17g697900v5 [Chlamydomonas reinhardtii]PNW69910.1 hypothetical protein CHLRE_17g697900v5 [Chlamydomonas reinhardtii]